MASTLRAALVAVAVVSAGAMAYVVPVPWGVLLAIPWLIIACWARTDWSAGRLPRWHPALPERLSCGLIMAGFPGCSQTSVSSARDCRWR
jgi:hypothetical protein